MTLETAEDGEPLGLPYWLGITISVLTVKVMPPLSIMCSVSSTHLTKLSILRTVSQRVSRAIARKVHAHRLFF